MYFAAVSRYHSYINSAKEILGIYSGTEPFSSFLKKYFASNKKFGSKDRKQINHLCYCYFRLGKAVKELITEDRIIAALFLCSNSFNEVLHAIKPEWNEKVEVSADEKFSMLRLDFDVQSSLAEIFPWKEELSDAIDHQKFCESFLIQPDLFIRIRPHYAETVLLKLEEIASGYEFISPFSVRLPNSFKVDDYFELDKEVVIQDYTSQQIAHLLPVDHGKKITVWDCCAASGGKSIMAYDINPNIELTVSDVRKSILINLKKRFQRAGINRYRLLVADLTSNRQPVTGNYDLIIADVPCTGSGTWSRTPEQLYYFDKNKIDEYAALQKKIVSNTIPHVKPGGHFLYVTCSVFRKENEKNVGFIKKQFDLELVRMEILKGYDMKSDTMFAALFKQRL